MKNDKKAATCFHTSSYFLSSDTSHSWFILGLNYRQPWELWSDWVVYWFNIAVCPVLLMFALSAYHMNTYKKPESTWLMKHKAQIHKNKWESNLTVIMQHVTCIFVARSKSSWKCNFHIVGHIWLAGHELDIPGLHTYAPAWMAWDRLVQCSL